MTDNIEEILRFWFQGIDDNTPIDTKALPFKQWFIKSDQFDAQIKEKFTEDLIKAGQGEYKEWEGTLKGRLALIILCDQYSRNLYRNTPKMFATDTLALDIALCTVEEGKDKEFQHIERTFIYMPFMHSEDLQIQKKCIECFKMLIAESKDKNSKNTFYFEYNLDYAKKHYDIIEKFQRFPHRNVILGRESTAEELEFLKKPGSSF